MANSVVQIGDKYYKKQYGDTMIKDISIVSQCVEGLGDYLKNYNCIKDALVEYFNEKNIDSEKINNMSDELSSMIINIISMSLKLSFEPISKTLEISKSMSYGIAIKSGFKLIEGVTSVDKMERVIKERKEEDVKIFLEKNFKYSLVIKLIMKKIKIKI